MDRVKQFWLSQAAAEYSSAAISAEFSHWLCQAGGSPDLICNVLDIAKDEIAHATLAFGVARQAGHQGGMQSGKQISFFSPTPFAELQKNILDVVIRFYCLGETNAVPLFAAMRKNAKKEAVHEAYNRIILDEPRHSEFGWITLAWIYANWPQVKNWLPECLTNAISQLSQEYYCFTEYSPPLTEEELAWGMLPKLEYGRIFEKNTSQSVCAPS